MAIFVGADKISRDSILHSNLISREICEIYATLHGGNLIHIYGWFFDTKVEKMWFESLLGGPTGMLQNAGIIDMDKASTIYIFLKFSKYFI